MVVLPSRQAGKRFLDSLKGLQIWALGAREGREWRIVRRNGAKVGRDLEIGEGGDIRDHSETEGGHSVRKFTFQ